MKNSSNYKKPSYFWYKTVFYTASKLVCKFKFNLKVKRNELKDAKGAYVLIGNHASVIDFMVSCVVNKRRAHFISSNSFVESVPVTPQVKKAQIIAKNQFQTTLPDMKKMKQVLDNDMPIILYPAGLMTEHGASLFIPPSTGKVLKWFNKPIYVIKSVGSYFTSPKWGKKWRKGQITVDAFKFKSIEELNEISADELYRQVVEVLDFNEYEEQKKNPIAFKGGNNISGVENIVHQCPHCKTEFAMKSTAIDVITCDNCGYSVKADNYGFFNKNSEHELYFDNVKSWYDFIKDDLKNTILSNDNYTLFDSAEIHQINYKKHKYEKVGDGTITLTKDKFCLIGEINGEPIKKDFATSVFPTLPFKPGARFELQDGKDIYRIVLKNGNQTIKWIMSLNIFFELNNK